MAANKVLNSSPELGNSPPNDVTAEFWANQCQKYEERIVELHSVIAELTRKLEDSNDVIKEESEFDEASVVTDSCLEEEDEVEAFGLDKCKWKADKASLAFEQALGDDRSDEDQASEYSDRSDHQETLSQEVLFKLELFDEIEKELFESKNENEHLRSMISDQEKTIQESNEILEQLRAEKETLKRQLEDLQSTLEFQEAKMDDKGRSNFFLRSSSVGGRRRSLRRKKDAKTDSSSGTPSRVPQATHSSTPSPVPSSQSYAITRSKSSEESKGLHNALLRKSSSNQIQEIRKSATNHNSDSKFRDLLVEFERLKTQSSHIESHNQVLELGLEESRFQTEQLSVALGKRESNESVLTLSLHYCDAIIEAYDVLVALLETENSVLQSCDSQRDEIGSIGSCGSSKSRRAMSQRRSAEKVAKHLLTRLDRTLTSAEPYSGLELGRGSDTRTQSSTTALDYGLSSPTGCWDDSSGYSHTTSSSTSTTSASSLHHQQVAPSSDGYFTKSNEIKLREFISQLKTIRATVQSTLVDVENIHTDNSVYGTSANHALEARLRQLELEEAIMKQELMASREEKADLRAKIYLLEKEKSGLKMMVDDRNCMEEVLRTRIQHLQELIHPEELTGGHEQVLRSRINNLFESLDKVSKNANDRHKHAIDLIEDLRKANR